MTEALHRDLQPLRRNVFDVTARLREAGVFFALNHLLHFYRGQIPLDAYLRLLDEVPALEARNGTMLAAHNALIERIAARWRPASPHAARRSSPAAMRTRCGASARRGPRRPAARATSFSSVCGRDWAGRAAGTAAPSPLPATPTASSRLCRRAGGLRTARSSGVAARGMPGVCRVSLPFQFMPLAIALAGKARERGARCVGARVIAAERWRRRPGALWRVARHERMTRASPSPASGSSPRSARRARRAGGACWRASAAFRPTTLFDTDGYRSRVAAEVDMDAVDAGLDAARTPPAVAQRSHRRPRGHRGGRRRGSARQRRRSLARRRLPRRRHRRSAAQRGVLPDLDHRRDRAGRGRRTPGIIFPARRSTSSPSGSASKARARAWSPPARRARSRSAAASRRFAPGRADAVLAGGTDALARLTFSGFNLLRLMDPAPCRPFDRSRAGMNIGEGAGILVLERSRSRAAPRRDDLRRARRPQPGLRGLPSDGAGAGRAAGRGGRRAGAARRGRQRGRGRSHQRARDGDAAERRRRSARLPARVRRPVARIPVTSIKSMIGHCLGAAGAVEAAALALTIARGVIPPTIHHAETDADCAIDVVANEAREQRVRCAVSTSLGLAATIRRS